MTPHVPEAAMRAASPALITVMMGLLFFVFGFVTWSNGPLITFVKLAFTLNDVTAFLVPMVFYMSYVFLALPAAAILRRTGMKRGMALGLFVMAIGAIVFGQSAFLRVFPATLVGLFVIGAGLAVLQTAANPYISIAGPIESAARRIAVMGICNKLAGILAPVVFGLLVLRDAGDLGDAVAATDNTAQREALLDAFAARVHMPYLFMAILLGVVALVVLKSPLPDLRPVRPARHDISDGRSLRSFPHLWLGVACLFLYVGVEVMAGDAIGAYGQAFGLPIGQTAFFTSFTLAAMLAGYVSGLVCIPRLLTQEQYLAASASLGAALVVGAFLTRGYVSVAFVAALGFANAMMWPAIFPLAINRLGRHVETGSAVLVMAISGGAVLPQMFAVLKQYLPFQLVFLLIMLPAYSYILFFALVGRRVGLGQGEPGSDPAAGLDALVSTGSAA